MLKKTNYTKIQIYLTGYGPFEDVKTNPSGLLAQALYDNRDVISKTFNGKISIESVKIMDVSCDYVDKNLPTLLNSMLSNKDETVMKLVIHFGVFTKIPAPILHLESNGKNYIDDRSTRKGAITNDMGISKAIYSKIDMSRCETYLPGYAVRSDDAGDFLCNYIYFSSLKTLMTEENNYAQFIHVPDLPVMSTQTGVNNVLQYINVLNMTYLN